MKHTRGDLIELFKQGQFDVIVHGCNCGCNMGDGIAKTIRDEFPEAYNADLATEKFDRSKLGTYTSAEVWRDRETSEGTERVLLGEIINAYTQFNWRRVGPYEGPLCDYEALRYIFMRLKREYGNQGKRFGVPAIGAARAGGDWTRISTIIDEELFDEDVTFVEFSGFDPKGNYLRNVRWISD